MGFCGLYNKGSVRLENISLRLKFAQHCTVFCVSHPQVFQDIGDQYRIDPDQVTRGRLLGRGAFGAVFAGTVHDKVSELQNFGQVTSQLRF